jgi:hypothetical protein
MNNLFEVLKHPIFWITSIIFTILLSILANLLTPRISVFLSKIDGTRKTKRKKILKEQWEQVLLYCEDKQLRINDKLNGIISLLKSIIILLFAVFFFLLAPLFFKPMWIFFSSSGVVLLVIGFVLFNNSLKALRITRIADNRELDVRIYLQKKGLDPGAEVGEAFLRGWDEGAFGIKREKAKS